MKIKGNGVLSDLVLPADVLILPVVDLSPNVLSKLTANRDDFVIVRPRSRAPSKVIDSNAAALLREFRTPTSIVQAIIRFGRKQRLDPAGVLNEAYPLLQELLKSRILVERNSTGAVRILPELADGSHVRSYTVVRCVHGFEDTEVYQVCDRSGQLFALKILRRGVSGIAKGALEREGNILKQLTAAPTPRLIQSGYFRGKLFLLTEWCHGENASIAAANFRRLPILQARESLVLLFTKIVEAYGTLHKQGILHGDVHPRNIIVSNSNSVKLIDFGFARSTRRADGLVRPGRAGIAFYLEPEYANAMVQGTDPPLVTPLGEQYSLGALLYLLMTGTYYVAFKLEAESFLRQILDLSPQPFSRIGVKPWPAMERVLRRALEKQPGRRFASLEHFASALNQLNSKLRPTKHLSHASRRGNGFSNVAHTQLDEVWKRYGVPGHLVQRGLTLAPTCSIYFGAAGIAYCFYRLAGLQNNPHLLAVSDIWATWAWAHRNTRGAFDKSPLGVTGRMVSRASLFNSIAGLYYVRALISCALGDFASLASSVRQFVQESETRSRCLDLVFGAAGTLTGCANLVELKKDGTQFDMASVRSLGEAVLLRIWRTVRTFGAVGDCDELPWLGAAHGWAGILYSTLRFCCACDVSLPAGVVDRLQQLARLARSTSRGMAWERARSQRLHETRLESGWCHGSAGHVYLWTLAHRLLREPTFIDLAQGAAEHTWRSVDQSEGNLCCGMAGQAYALLHLYGYTGERKWLVRARKLSKYAIADTQSVRLRPHSLFKGDIGIALLSQDILHPEDCCMPILGSETGAM